MEMLVIFLMAVVILYYWLKKPVSAPTQTKSAPTQEQEMDGILTGFLVDALDDTLIARRDPLFDEMISEHLRYIKDKILETDDPLRNNRLWFADNVIRLATAQVLTLTPNCKTFLYNHPAISGTLKPYLIQIVGQDESFAYAKEKGIPKEAWEGLVRDRFDVSMFRANVANKLRTIITNETMKKEGDWFRPALMAACIFEEDCMRRKIGMKPLLNSHFSGLLYVSLIERITEGHADPLQVWNQRMSEGGNKFETDGIYLPSCEYETAFEFRNAK